jgi:hypothetical protein
MTFGPNVANLTPKAASLAFKFLMQRDRVADAIRFALAYENYSTTENYAAYVDFQEAA